MPSTGGGHGSWAGLRRLPGRIPLRVKLVTALLALVAIALAVISVASVSVFRDYQIRHASQQATDLFEQTASDLRSPHALQPGTYIAFGPYFAAMVPAGSSLTTLTRGNQNTPGSLPKVPTGPSWLKANAAQMVDVPAISGTDNWRVIVQRVTFVSRDFFTGQQRSQTSTLIVGVDLGDINGTVGQLASIDLIVSLIIVVGVAIVGIAIVRASLRPLTDIEQTAEAIAAGDLSRRVPDRDPGTEIGRLGRSLNTMLAQIESSFHAREESETAARRSEERMRQFVADASHELRTPLTAMRGYAEYYRQRGGLREEPAAGQPPGAAPADTPAANPATADPATADASAAGPVPAGPAPADDAPAAAGAGEAGAGLASGAGSASAANGKVPLSRIDLDRIMQRVEQESTRMGVLVEDMLLLARLDQQRPIERRPVDLLTLAADAVQDARMIAPQRRIDLTVGSGAAFLVLGDEVRLRQVIGNLMTNALTHTPEDAPIDVRILADRQGGVPAVAIEVADQGPGLRADQAERVFERFYRADQARTRRTGGTGLGLAIVSALVTAHDGTVSVDSTPGQGATFRITLPLAPEAQDRQPDQDEAPIPDVPDSTTRG